MKGFRFQKKLCQNTLIPFLILLTINLAGAFSERKATSSLLSLLPEITSWKMSEAPQSYFPETLFEYINGAAEIYLAYDFKELIVGNYESDKDEASLSIEIYDMANKINSFGIYSAERFPDNKFISVGSQGYLEEGSLNFIIGRYYIKLLCFDCEEKFESLLNFFSQKIVKRVGDKESLPPLLDVFPEVGLIKNSEKFVLRNFMGYEFMNNGYVANYKLDELDFDCFLIDAENVEKATNIFSQYLNTKNKQSLREISEGYRIQDTYYKGIYLTRVDNYICGVRKIKEGFEEIGEKYLRLLIESLRK